MQVEVVANRNRALINVESKEDYTRRIDFNERNPNSK